MSFGITSQTDFVVPACFPVKWRLIAIIPIAQPKFVKDGGNGDPLLKVPPARRGNRTGARLEGDVDCNGCVDDADLLTVLFAFGSGC